MLFLGIAAGVMGCAAEVMPTDEEMVAEEGQEIAGAPEGAEVALEEVSAEDFALIEAAEVGDPAMGQIGDNNEFTDEDESGGGYSSGQSCTPSCQDYHGGCTGFSWGSSTASCTPFSHTVYGVNTYAWMRICESPCGGKYVAATGSGYCWW